MDIRALGTCKYTECGMICSIPCGGGIIMLLCANNLHIPHIRGKWI